MRKLYLNNSDWRLLDHEKNLLCDDVKVPGSVFSALVDAGQMEDPYWRDNEMLFFPLGFNDYAFVCTVEIPDDLVDSQQLILCCDGLDTLADVYINRNLAGQADNMHRRWRFDITSLLRKGSNEIEVSFRAPLKFIKEQNKKLPLDGSHDSTEGFPHLRKAHCMFGWDWGPRLPDMGIWRDIYIEGISSGRLVDVYCRQHHDKDVVKLVIDVSAEYPQAAQPDNYTFKILVTSPDGQVHKAGASHEILIENPQLWWPNGLGSQPLYQLEVQLLKDGALVDTITRKIGLRTMELIRHKDVFGESFFHQVNRTAVFAKGADYIPEDCLFTRMTPRRTRKLLEDMVLANMNTVRVWGGAAYPADWFFDICDELGLLVWQDFMFACAIYELSDDFETNIAAELTDNIRRLRHHPSLALWCGNNEMEWQVDDKVWQYTPRQFGDYIRMYEYLFPKIVQAEDPQTPYWPASPSSGGSFDYPNDPDRGDVHFWEVWHSNKPFTEYRKHYFRYVSEFGFQSFPDLKTIETFTLPEDRNIFSHVMDKHQRNNGANGKIMQYMSQYFLYPHSFETVIYASQLLQAEAIRYGVEHWRRNHGRCMGAVYWQLNDCWPVASWASIDYEGRWKALQYYAKRFFAPILISCEEQGLLNQGNNINQEPFDMETSARLCVTNETGESITGEVCWQLRDNQAKILEDGSTLITAAPASAVWLDTLDFPDCDPARHYLSFAFKMNGTVISEGTALFYPPKYFVFEDPKLEIEVFDQTIRVRSKAHARSVQIVSADDDVLLSDNYFDMNNEEKLVTVLRGSAKNLTVRSVYDIGRC